MIKMMSGRKRRNWQRGRRREKKNEVWESEQEQEDEEGVKALVRMTENAGLTQATIISRLSSLTDNF